jgi:hypothetical protein
MEFHGVFYSPWNSKNSVELRVTQSEGGDEGHSKCMFFKIFITKAKMTNEQLRDLRDRLVALRRYL